MSELNSNTMKIGVIGSGYWGPNLIRNFNELSSSKVLGVADLRQDRLQSIQNSYPHIRTTRDYRDLFEMKLDAAVIATPPTTHYKIARDALEHGLHVLVEKPLTLNCQQAEELIELAQRKNLILMVGHTFIFNAAVQNLKCLIQSGDLGQIYYIDTARLNLGLYQNGLNVLWDLAPHDISILLYLLDSEPISICARGMECVVKGIHDVAFIDLVFPNNILAHIHVSWLDPCKVRRVTVVGHKKMVVYNDVEALDKIKIFDRGIELPAYTRDFAEFQCSYRYGDILIPNIKFSEPLRKECQHFIDCISNQAEPITNAREGLKVVKILEAAEHALGQSSYQEVLA